MSKKDNLGKLRKRIKDLDNAELLKRMDILTVRRRMDKTELEVIHLEIHKREAAIRAAQREANES